MSVEDFRQLLRKTPKAGAPAPGNSGSAAMEAGGATGPHAAGVASEAPPTPPTMPTLSQDGAQGDSHPGPARSFRPAAPAGPVPGAKSGLTEASLNRHPFASSLVEVAPEKVKPHIDDIDVVSLTMPAMPSQVHETKSKMVVTQPQPPSVPHKRPTKVAASQPLPNSRPQSVPSQGRSTLNSCMLKGLKVDRPRPEALMFSLSTELSSLNTSAADTATPSTALRSSPAGGLITPTSVLGGTITPVTSEVLGSALLTTRPEQVREITTAEALPIFVELPEELLTPRTSASDGLVEQHARTYAARRVTVGGGSEALAGGAELCGERLNLTAPADRNRNRLLQSQGETHSWMGPPIVQGQGLLSEQFGMMTAGQCSPKVATACTLRCSAVAGSFGTCGGGGNPQSPSASVELSALMAAQFGQTDSILKLGAFDKLDATGFLHRHGQTDTALQLNVPSNAKHRSLCSGSADVHLQGVEYWQGGG